MQKLFSLRKHLEEEEKENNLLQEITIKQIACGYYHTILLDQNNNIYARGTNHHGQLGTGKKESIETFQKIESFNNKVKLIACGGYFTIVVTLQNEIFGTGMTFIQKITSTFIEIKKPYKNFIVKKMKCGSGFIIVMNNKNELYGCGVNNNYQLGFKETKLKSTFVKLDMPYCDFTKIKDFGCGYGYTIILTDDGNVYCSGNDLFLDYTNFKEVDLLFFCKQISCLYETVYFLSNNNEIYCKEKNKNYIYKIIISNHKKIKKIYSGLGNDLFILNEDNEIYKFNTKSNFQKVRDKWNLKYLSIYSGNNFALILNSNISLEEEEESLEMERMKYLLLEQIIKKNCSLTDILIVVI